MASDRNCFRISTLDDVVMILPQQLLTASITFTNLLADTAAADTDDTIPLPITHSHLSFVIEWVMHEDSLTPGDERTTFVKRDDAKGIDPSYVPSPWDVDYLKRVTQDDPIIASIFLNHAVNYLYIPNLTKLLMYHLGDMYVLAKSPKQIRDIWGLDSCPDDEDERFSSEDDDVMDELPSSEDEDEDAEC